jgi:hypothetical protein
VQRHPRDIRLDLGNLDPVVSVDRRLRHARHICPAMRAMLGQNVALARRIRMQGTMRPGMRLALGTLRGIAVALLSFGRRRAGIVRRLRRQLQLLAQCRVLGPQRHVLGFQAGKARRQHLDLPGQRGNRVRLRQNQPDQTFLVERINAVAIHPELESPRTPLVKNYPSPGNRGEQLRRNC